MTAIPTVQSALRNILIRPDVVSITGVSNIYDMVIPENITMPCITLQRISENIDPVTHIRKTMMQVDCYSPDHIVADNTAEKVQSVLMNHSESGTVNILSIVPTNITDLSVPETRLFRVTCDYAVVWTYT